MKKQKSTSWNNNVDDMFKQLKEMCFNSAEEDVKLYIKQLEIENKKLRKSEDSLKSEVIKLNEKVKCLETENHINSLSGKLFMKYKETVDDILYEEGEKAVLKLCKSLITPTYEVSDSDQLRAPVWIVLMTMFYDNRETIIEIMDYFNIKHPQNVNTFKLPCDWNEEELDYFMKAMAYNVVCNGCYFKDNLQFWYPTALMSVEDQCLKRPNTYTEIPWQFVLRNPLLKKSKYLSQIGKNLFTPYNYGYEHFLEIEKYTMLNTSEILTIIDNININDINKNNEKKFYQFIATHIELLSEKNYKYILDKFFEVLVNYHAYDCVSSDALFKMPTEYINKWFEISELSDIIKFIQCRLVEKTSQDNNFKSVVMNALIKKLKEDN